MASMPGGLNRKERHKLKSSQPTSRRARRQAAKARKQARRAKQLAQAERSESEIAQTNGRSRSVSLPSAASASYRRLEPRIRRESALRLVEREEPQQEVNVREPINYTQRQIDALNRTMQERGYNTPVSLRTRIMEGGSKRQFIRSKRNKQTRKATEGIQLVGAGKVQSLFLLRPTNSWDNTNEVSRKGYTDRFLRIIGEYSKTMLKRRINDSFGAGELAQQREEFTRGVLESIRRTAESRAAAEPNDAKRRGLINLAEFADRISDEYDTRIEQSKRAQAERRAAFGNRRRRNESEPESTVRERESPPEPQPEIESRFYDFGDHTLRITGPRIQGGREIPRPEPTRNGPHPGSLEARMRASEADHFRAKEEQERRRLAERKILEEYRTKNLWRRWKYADVHDRALRAAVIKEQQKKREAPTPNVFKRGWNATKAGFKKAVSRMRRAR